MPTRVRGVLAFCAMAFVPTWLYAFFAIAEDISLVNPVAQLGFAFFPAVAAFVTRKWVTREGFADAGLRPRWRTAWPQYLLALAGPFLMVVAALVIAAVVGRWDGDLSRLSEATLGLPLWVYPLVPIVLVPLYFGEDFGWTAYLRDRLFPGRPVAATVATGLIWGLWHFPLAFSDYVRFPALLPGLAIWTVSFLFQEILLSWLWLRSGSIWTACLAHAGNNMVLFLFVGTLIETDGMDPSVTTVLVTIPMVVASLWAIGTGRLAAKRGASQPATAGR